MLNTFHTVRLPRSTLTDNKQQINVSHWLAACKCERPSASEQAILTESITILRGGYAAVQPAGIAVVVIAAVVVAVAAAGNI